MCFIGPTGVVTDVGQVMVERYPDDNVIRVSSLLNDVHNTFFLMFNHCQFTNLYLKNNVLFCVRTI